MELTEVLRQLEHLGCTLLQGSSGVGCRCSEQLLLRQLMAAVSLGLVLHFIVESLLAYIKPGSNPHVPFTGLQPQGQVQFLYSPVL